MRYQDDQHATRFQGPLQGHHRRGRIGDIFEYVNAQHSVERFLQVLEIGGAFGIQLAHTDVRRAQEAIAERVQVERVFLARHVKQPAAHETRRDIANAGAGLEYRVSDKRPQYAHQPAQVLRRTGEVVQDGAAVRGGVEVVDQPELQHHTKRPDSVLPADLLALFVSAAVITDRDFVDPQLALRRFHDDFGFEA